MTQKPRESKKGVFSDGLASLIITRGILIGAGTLAVFAAILRLGGDTDLARTGAFTTLVLMQLVHVLNANRKGRAFLKYRFFNNIYLVLAVACSAIMMLAAIYLPFLQNLFKTVPLKLSEWSLVAGASLLARPYQVSFAGKEDVKR